MMPELNGLNAAFALPAAHPGSEFDLTAAVNKVTNAYKKAQESTQGTSSPNSFDKVVESWESSSFASIPQIWEASSFKNPAEDAIRLMIPQQGYRPKQAPC
jgi:hypothetical protein